MLHVRHPVQAAALIALIASAAHAGHYCDHCGCHRNCKKVCRLECGKKKETKTEYSAECEDFCVPGPSKKCGVKVECDCNGRPHRKILWQPTCAKVYTRKTLAKKEVTKEVPDYKWVVEQYCCVCGQMIKVDGKETAAGDKKAERLPKSVAAIQHPANTHHPADAEYRDYFVDADSDRSEFAAVPAELTGDAPVDEASFDEQSPDASPAEPRRLFSGLFGR